MTNELNAAVERWRKSDYPDDYGCAAKVCGDAHKLANAYIAHLDAQAAIAAERALPIDEGWVSTMPQAHKTGTRWYSFDAGGEAVFVQFSINGSFDVYINDDDCILLWIKSRGQLLDLLAALGQEVGK